MRKIAIILILASSAFAKFPHESDARTKLLTASKSTSLIKGAKNFVGFDYDHTNGKIEAAIYNMKIEKMEELKQDTLELLMRVSTVEKLNMDRSEPIAVDNLISELKAFEANLDQLDIEAVDLRGLELLKEEINEKTFVLEDLLLEL